MRQRDVLKSANGPANSFLQAAGGANLFYKDWGAGKPAVFLHGWSLNSDAWAYQMIALAGQGIRCVAYDRRGHGRSSDPGRGYDYDTLADDLAAVIGKLDLREVTLVGHSMAAGEIVRYLSRHGASRVARAVFLAPTAPFHLKTADNPEGIDARAFEQLRAVLCSDYPKWLADSARTFVVPETSPEMMKWLESLMLQCSMKAVIDCNLALTETDFRGEMRKVTTPALIVQGDRDQSAPLHLTGKKAAELIPGSQLKVYEGAPHGLFITHMERLNGDLLAYIRS